MAWTWYYMILILTHLWHADIKCLREQNSFSLIKNYCGKKKKKNRPTWIRVDMASLKLQLNTSLKYFAWDKSRLSEACASRPSWGGQNPSASQTANRLMDRWGPWPPALHPVKLVEREWQSRFTHRFGMTEVRGTRKNERKEAIHLALFVSQASFENFSFCGNHSKVIPVAFQRSGASFLCCVVFREQL